MVKPLLKKNAFFTFCHRKNAENVDKSGKVFCCVILSVSSINIFPFPPFLDNAFEANKMVTILSAVLDKVKGLQQRLSQL